jgi:CO/xanthine dehydrogenase FAD-binding subunit
MDVFLPRTLDEALEIKAGHPEAVPIAGGTDVMVDVNFDRLRPPAFVDVTRIPDLLEWRREDGDLFLGAGVTYTRIMAELPELTPLAQASRTVGSPQIRNRATVGGNLGTASPAGDALPVLAAYDAEVVLASASGGNRTMPWSAFHTGVKTTAMRPDELILGARWRLTRGPGSFSKVGTRGAMIISMAGLCLVVDEDQRAVRAALGSVATTVVRASDAEAFVSEALGRAGAWDDPAAGLDHATRQEFAERVAAAASPIDDVRGTAAYRRHACRVLAGRALSWALSDRRVQ